MKRHIPIAAMSAAVLASSLYSMPSQAGSGSASVVSTQNVIPQQLEVASNGSSYTQVGPFGNIVAEVAVGIKTGGSISNWTTWLRIGAEEQDDDYQTYWIDFSVYSFDQSYPPGNRPSVVDRTVTVAIPAAAYGSMAVSHCNFLAGQLRAQGLSDHQIFAQDRTIELGVRAELQYDSNPFGVVFDSYGSSDNELDWADIQKFDLVCKKWDGVAIPQVADQLDSMPLVEQASLTVLEQQGPTQGHCKISLSGAIETSEPDVEVTFRYKDKKGNESGVHSVETDHAGIAMFSHDYDVPTNEQGPETGQVRIAGVSHPFESAWAGYEMDCSGPSFQALVPPKVEIDVVPVDKVRMGQQVCYSKVKLYAKVTAQNAAMSGQGIFIGDYYFSEPQAYEIEAGETTLLGGERELDWTPDPEDTKAAAPTDPAQPKQQTIQIGFNLTNANNTVVASVPKKPYTIKCYVPKVNAVVLGGDNGLSAAPRPNPAPGTAPQLRLAPKAAQTTRPTPPAAGGQVAARVTLPDLKIQRARPGRNKNRLRIRVANAGPGNAGASKLKAVYRQGGKNIVRTVPVKALKAGGKTVVVVDFGKPVKKARRISLKVDAPNQVKETNERNNKRQFKG